MKIATVYLDTSVINFLFHDDVPEFRKITEHFFNTTIKLGLVKCYVSDYVLEEVNQTKDKTKRDQLLKVISDYNIEIVELTKQQEEEIEELANKYLEVGIIPAKKVFDALHVAIVSVLNIDYLVSWNYKHLANVNKEAKFLQLNYTMNYHHNLRLVSPTALTEYGND